MSEKNVGAKTGQADQVNDGLAQPAAVEVAAAAPQDVLGNTIYQFQTVLTWAGAVPQFQELEPEDVQKIPPESLVIKPDNFDQVAQFIDQESLKVVEITLDPATNDTSRSQELDLSGLTDQSLALSQPYYCWHGEGTVFIEDNPRFFAADEGFEQKTSSFIFLRQVGDLQTFYSNPTTGVHVIVNYETDEGDQEKLIFTRFTLKVAAPTNFTTTTFAGAGAITSFFTENGPG